MTIEEINKYKRPLPLSFPFTIEEVEVQDEYGVYRTGFYEYKGKTIVVAIEEGRWHLSAAANHTLGYYELKEIRYKFMPNAMAVAQIFPPREEFVNVHPNCFHLWELRD